jgi:hypothetical protein
VPKKPTAEDAEIIMRLYDLRREPEMRKARGWFAGFWPRNADDVVQVINSVNPQQNAWFRMVSSYWDMAASFVLRGALNEELFVDNSGEMFFVLAKVYPFLKEVREKTHTPYLQRVEKIATRTKEARERLQATLKRAEARRAAAAAKAS